MSNHPVANEFPPWLESFIAFLLIGEERDEREDTASPVLFSTPPEDPEQLSGIKVSKKRNTFFKECFE